MRPYLLATTAPIAAVAYASQPLPPLDMPVMSWPMTEFEKRSTDSAFMFPYWEKVDAILDGIEGMKGQGEKYLPKFAEEKPAEYKFRSTQVKMTNVYRDIVEGLSSKPFEQSVRLIKDETDATTDAVSGDAPDEIKKFYWNVDGSGNNMTVFAAETFFRGVNYGVDWIMVDHPPKDNNVRNLADAKRRGVRPYWSHISARNVLDVRSEMMGGVEVITYFKVFEPGDPDHIRLYERNVNGATWALYRRDSEDKTFKRVGGGPISIGVIPVVPFATGRRDGRRWRFDPPMRAAAELQVELYQQESGLKFIKTLSAYPMLAANGIARPKGQDGKPVDKVAIGPTRILWSEADNAGNIGRWEWLTPNSEVLKFLADDVKETIQQLRELGRQPLTASSSNITVITAAVASGKAKSAVKAWAYTLKDALENALIYTALWMALEYEPTAHVYAEFDDWMEGEDLDALATMREKGDMSLETLWEEMQRRGVLSSNFTAERERKRLLTELPGDGEDTQP